MRLNELKEFLLFLALHLNNHEDEILNGHSSLTSLRVGLTDRSDPLFLTDKLRKNTLIDLLNNLSIIGFEIMYSSWIKKIPTENFNFATHADSFTYLPRKRVSTFENIYKTFTPEELQIINTATILLAKLNINNIPHFFINYVMNHETDIVKFEKQAHLAAHLSNKGKIFITPDGEKLKFVEGTMKGIISAFFNIGEYISTTARDNALLTKDDWKKILEIKKDKRIDALNNLYFLDLWEDENLNQILKERFIQCALICNNIRPKKEFEKSLFERQCVAIMGKPRIGILLGLSRGPRDRNELEGFAVNRTALSFHLKILKNAELVVQKGFTSGRERPFSLTKLGNNVAAKLAYFYLNQLPKTKQSLQLRGSLILRELAIHEELSKKEIDKISGKNTEYSLSSLLKKQLIQEQDKKYSLTESGAIFADIILSLFSDDIPEVESKTSERKLKDTNTIIKLILSNKNSSAVGIASFAAEIHQAGEQKLALNWISMMLRILSKFYSVEFDWTETEYVYNRQPLEVYYLNSNDKQKMLFRRASKLAYEAYQRSDTKFEKLITVGLSLKGKKFNTIPDFAREISKKTEEIGMSYDTILSYLIVLTTYGSTKDKNGKYHPNEALQSKSRHLRFLLSFHKRTNSKWRRKMNILADFCFSIRGMKIIHAEERPGMFCCGAMLTEKVIEDAYVSVGGTIRHYDKVRIFECRHCSRKYV
ncbi:ArsR/SmtB family transcription factor [Candidatus Undinarchaeota archaeon]